MQHLHILRVIVHCIRDDCIEQTGRNTVGILISLKTIDITLLLDRPYFGKPFPMVRSGWMAARRYGCMDEV